MQLLRPASVWMLLKITRDARTKRHPNMRRAIGMLALNVGIIVVDHCFETVSVFDKHALVQLCHCRALVRLLFDLFVDVVEHELHCVCHEQHVRVGTNGCMKRRTQPILSSPSFP